MEVNSIRCEILGFFCNLIDVFALLGRYEVLISNQQLTNTASNPR
jgi:hypothetical protein